MNYPKNSGKINLFLKNYFDFQQVINDRYDQCEGKTYTIQSNRKWTREQLTWQWGNEVGFVDFVKTQQNDDRVRIIKVEEKNEGEKKRRKDEKKTRKRERGLTKGLRSVTIRTTGVAWEQRWKKYFEKC